MNIVYLVFLLCAIVSSCETLAWVRRHRAQTRNRDSASGSESFSQRLLKLNIKKKKVCSSYFEMLFQTENPYFYKERRKIPNKQKKRSFSWNNRLRQTNKPALSKVYKTSKSRPFLKHSAAVRKSKPLQNPTVRKSKPLQNQTLLLLTQAKISSSHNRRSPRAAPYPPPSRRPSDPSPSSGTSSETNGARRRVSRSASDQPTCNQPNSRARRASYRERRSLSEKREQLKGDCEYIIDISESLSKTVDGGGLLGDASTVAEARSRPRYRIMVNSERPLLSPWNDPQNLQMIDFAKLNEEVGIFRAILLKISEHFDLGSNSLNISLGNVFCLSREIATDMDQQIPSAPDVTYTLTAGGNMDRSTKVSWFLRDLKDYFENIVTWLNG